MKDVSGIGTLMLFVGGVNLSIVVHAWTFGTFIPINLLNIAVVPLMLYSGIRAWRRVVDEARAEERQQYGYDQER